MVFPQYSTRVFVGNISWHVKWQDLKDHMREVGPVVRADIFVDVTGRSKGCGIVEYGTQQDAQLACERLSGTVLAERKIWVREDRDNCNKGMGHNPPRQDAPRYGNQPYRQYGYGYYNNGPPRGGGANGGGDRGGGYHNNWNKHPIRRGDRKKVFLANLPANADRKWIGDTFGAFGVIEDIQMHHGPNQEFKGNSTVCFRSTEDAQSAIDQMHNALSGDKALVARWDRFEFDRS